MRIAGSSPQGVQDFVKLPSVYPFRGGNFCRAGGRRACWRSIYVVISG